MAVIYENIFLFCQGFPLAFLLPKYKPKTKVLL